MASKLPKLKEKSHSIKFSKSPTIQSSQMISANALPKTKKINPKDTLNRGSPLQVVPPELHFPDIEPGQIYEVLIFVKNLSIKPKRIRIYQPQTNKFRCDYDMQGAVAAGMAMKMVVRFECQFSGEYHDSLKIVSEDQAITVPLHATPPRMQVIFEPFLNFGFVKYGKEKIEVDLP